MDQPLESSAPTGPPPNPIAPNDELRELRREKARSEQRSKNAKIALAVIGGIYGLGAIGSVAIPWAKRKVRGSYWYIHRRGEARNRAMEKDLSRWRLQNQAKAAKDSYNAWRKPVPTLLIGDPFKKRAWNDWLKILKRYPNEDVLSGRLSKVKEAQADLMAQEMLYPSFKELRLAIVNQLHGAYTDNDEAAVNVLLGMLKDLKEAAPGYGALPGE